MICAGNSSKSTPSLMLLPVLPPLPQPFPGLTPDAFEGVPCLLGLADGAATTLRQSASDRPAFSLRHERSLWDFTLTDFGDLTEDASFSGALTALAEISNLPLVVSGSRAPLPELVSVLQKASTDLSLLQVSAFADFRDTGTPEQTALFHTLSHLQPERIVSEGVRTLFQEERKYLLSELPPEGPVLLAFDLSVFDPSLLPVLRADAGGWLWEDFLSASGNWPWERIAAIFLSGLDPSGDHRGGFAAKLVQELFFQLTSPERHSPPA